MSVTAVDSRSINSLRSSSSGQKKVVPRRSSRLHGKKVPAIPWAAHWGWSHLPFAAKVLILGVFCGAVSLTTPFWAYIKTDAIGYATYGLWHFCRGEECGSIHDNILDGKSVPGEFPLIEGCKVLWLKETHMCDQSSNEQCHAAIAVLLMLFN